MVDDILLEAEDAMDRTLTALSDNFAAVRTGRANSRLLDKIKVEYYGQMTPINQMAGIKTPEAHMLVVEPWDKSMLRAIEAAIMASDLGVTPSNDGQVIRLPFPEPTEERRRELVKQCKTLAEESRISIRNTRREANSAIERAMKTENLPEDEAKRAEAQVQKLTDEHIAAIDEAFKKKEAEVMEI